MMIKSESYYLGHDNEIHDQDIVDKVVSELHRIGVDAFVFVHTKLANDCVVKEGNKHYTSEILITYDSNEIKADDYDITFAVSKAMNYFRGEINNED